MPASRRLAWGVLTFFCVSVALVAPLPALLGFYGEQAPAGSQLAHLIELARTPLLAVHAIAGAIALLVSPWQLAARWRARAPRWHRRLGYIYVVGVAASGAAGLVLGPSAWGASAKVGFTALAIVWLWTTARAVQAARGRDLERHAVWMRASFALTFAAVSLRLQLPVLGLLHVDPALSYGVVAWTCWVPNLALAVAWTRRRADVPSLSPA